MNEPLTELEQRLVSAVREHLGRAELDARPAAVVAHVTGRRIGRLAGMRRWVAAGVVASLVLAVAGAALVGPRLLELAQGSHPAMVSVNGRDYFVGMGRGLIVDAADLLPHGRVEAPSDPRAAFSPLLNATAYSLPGVDPAEALFLPHGGAFDDQIDAGDYAILWGGREPMRQPSAAVCAYLAVDSRGDACPPDAGVVRLLPFDPLPSPYDWPGIGSALATRGFEIKRPTPAEVARLDISAVQVIAEFEASLTDRPDAPSLVSVHVAAVGLAIERLGLERERELMYIAETTGHRTGNCFELRPALPSEVPTFVACFFSGRSSPGGSPAPTVTPAGEAPQDRSALNASVLWERSYVLDGVTLELEAIVVPGLAAAGFVDWRLLDEHSLVLSHRPGDAPAAEPDPVAVWLADLALDELRRVPTTGPVLDVDATGERLLLWEPGALSITDRSGHELHRLPLAFPAGRFLADGTVVAGSGGRLMLWQPGAGIGSETLVPQDMQRYGTWSVAERVALFGMSFGARSRSALFDPGTWEQVGPDWRTAGLWQAATSPDGTRFVIAVDDGAKGEHLEIRAVDTGELLAVGGTLLTGAVTGLAWPTDGVIVALRDTQQGAGPPQPELHLAASFDADPLPIEPFLADQRAWVLSSRGDRMLAVGERGDLLLIVASEVGRSVP